MKSAAERSYPAYAAMAGGAMGLLLAPVMVVIKYMTGWAIIPEPGWVRTAEQALGSLVRFATPPGLWTVYGTVYTVALMLMLIAFVGLFGRMRDPQGRLASALSCWSADASWRRADPSSWRATAAPLRLDHHGDCTMDVSVASRRRGLLLAAGIFALFWVTTLPHAKTPDVCANFAQVGQGFYRGAEPTTQCLGHLAALGVRTIVNLRDEEDASALEQKEAAAHGMRYINVPMSGFARPEMTTVQQILAIVHAPENQPVFLHCKRGADRTGAIVAAHRMERDGWTTDRAFQEAKNFGLAWYQIRMKVFIRDFCSVASCATGVTPR